jgi:hypothetical protein
VLHIGYMQDTGREGTVNMSGISDQYAGCHAKLIKSLERQ